MPKPIAIVAAYDHVDWRLQDCLRAAGVPLMYVTGCADWPKVRSVLLSRVLQTDADVVLLVESDTVLAPQGVAALIESPKLAPDAAVTAAYVSDDHRIVFTPDKPDHPCELRGSPRFVQGTSAGLACAAVHRHSLEAVREQLPELQENDVTWWPFCLPQLVKDERASAGAPRYFNEALSFWRRLREMADTTLWLDTHLVVGRIFSRTVEP